MVKLRRETNKPQLLKAVALLLVGMLVVPAALAGPLESGSPSADEVREALVLEQVVAVASFQLVELACADRFFSELSKQGE